jgi:hypothetical protein
MMRRFVRAVVLLLVIAPIGVAIRSVRKVFRFRSRRMEVC